ncbi:Oidioi.mRNA.OKI2018_I69.PAR.g8645.t1.cds [Oikopleura dioica]|uniref:Oidioi.mRNA.OKI2018_I69.PAR.g8645.t1.cds n=1 Tax=Oikopleura dioica TaxID=34765 RepID=A0ABN7RKY8_OIKDI|nr:Oidioi.mRNA.OKI2018_I69.PAR.g8645.t1.cds [Oikopleura dioica]
MNMTITEDLLDDYKDTIHPALFTEEGMTVELKKEKERELNKIIEFWWTFGINIAVLVLIVVMIVVFNYREFEDVGIGHLPSFWQKKQVLKHFLTEKKCEMGLNKSYMTELMNSTADIPASSQGEYSQHLLLESSVIDQLIRNLTCEYLPDHKVMT